MTTVSSEDSNSAPRIFHTSDHVSSYASSVSSDSNNLCRCRLCKKYRKVFYCKECIQNGSITKNYESLQSIRTTLDENQQTRRQIEKMCMQSLKRVIQWETLRNEARQGKERNRILQLALEEKRHRKMTLNQQLTELKERNQETRETLKKYKRKADSLGDASSKKCESLRETEAKLSELYVRVKKFSRLRVHQLFEYVFPISEVKPAVEMESSGDSTARELAEASQTNYIKDMWVYADYSNETQFSVVAPCLPGSGNYSNYNVWAQSSSRDGVGVTDDTAEVNPAISISAALTYTAQLVNVLSFLLNVRLPHKIVYSDFSSLSLKEQQFSKRVARLNANILHLCISQGVDLTVLSPTSTIHNLLQLRDHKSADLGSQGPIEVHDLEAKPFENAIAADLKSVDDSGSEEGDSFTVEWEAVPYMQCPEALPGPANVQSSVINTQQASSMAGGLMNSAVAGLSSFWRGFTGR